MYLADRLWTTITYVVSFLSLTPVREPINQEQTPLFDAELLQPSHFDTRPVNSGTKGTLPDLDSQAKPKGPIFKPPTGRPQGPGSDFVCDYTKMPSYRFCSTEQDRTCWLIDDATGDQYNITTDYETKTPIGVDRYYEIELVEGHVDADGLPFDEAKLFDGKYPGPWIQACWGDRLIVNVTNRLPYNGGNGTSVHWHGLRQLNTTHMDGVNGLTQCPIAPRDYFVYNFTIKQYGSSWYHSHHSVQYADGALGPLTLHGPTIIPYDEAQDPILVTDWGHNSAFDAIQTSLETPSILLNGIGNITRSFHDITSPSIKPPHTLYFEPKPEGGPAKRYLLRIINTSFASTFNFSIDNHKLQVVEADFVPIYNYTTENLVVAIGQRYNVIVEADPEPNLDGPPPEDGNFWIRTWEADCTDFFQYTGDFGYERTGIVSYNQGPVDNAESTPWPDADQGCADESYANLKPVVPWNVGPPANVPSNQSGELLQVIFQKSPTIFPLAKFSLAGVEFDPLQVDYSDPTFLHLNYTGKWNPLAVVLSENYTSEDWIYFVIKSGGGHPIHLHGHDFAILAQVEGEQPPESLTLTTDNPPRRDVVLLPDKGFVIIAFKADNPGNWLMHCHIAYHASFGLGLQILESQTVAAEIWPSLNASHALRETQRVCDNWNKWWGDCSDWWPGSGKSCGIGESGFSPDSGI